MWATVPGERFEDPTLVSSAVSDDPRTFATVGQPTRLTHLVRCVALVM